MNHPREMLQKVNTEELNVGDLLYFPAHLRASGTWSEAELEPVLEEGYIHDLKELQLMNQVLRVHPEMTTVMEHRTSSAARVSKVMERLSILARDFVNSDGSWREE